MSETRDISLALSNDIVYVTGTVNDVDKVFTLVDTVWQTTADRSADDIYYITVTCVNNLGRTATLSTVVYYGLHLVTDRTRSDIEAHNAKSYYNYTDLNRIESATVYVADELNGIGHYTTLLPQTLWVLGQFAIAAEMRRCLANIHTVARQLGAPITIFALPSSMDSINYIGANNIELCLERVDTYISNIKAQPLNAGTIYAGEEW